MAGEVFKDCEIEVGAQDIAPQLNQVGIEETRDEKSWECFQDTALSKDVGPLNSIVTMDGVYTSGATEAATVIRTLMHSGASTTLDIYPKGNAPGNEKISGTAYVLSNGTVLPRSDKGTISVRWAISGELVWTTIT